MRLVSLGMTTALLHLICTLSATAADPTVQYVQKDLEWGKALNLENFGCPHIEIFIRNREMSYVTVGTADFTRMVPIARTNVQSVEVNNFNNTATVYGNTSLDMQPTRNTRTVQKKDGIAFPGSNSMMYLAYQEPSTGIKVYYLDAIAPQNRDSIVIAVPKRLPQPSVPPALAPPSLPSVAPTSGATIGAQKATDGQPITPELFSQYIILQKEREALDTSDPEAVNAFNARVAAYHEALKTARARQQK